MEVDDVQGTRVQGTARADNKLLTRNASLFKKVLKV